MSDVTEQIQAALDVCDRPAGVTLRALVQPHYGMYGESGCGTVQVTALRLNCDRLLHPTPGRAPAPMHHHATQVAGHTDTLTVGPWLAELAATAVRALDALTGWEHHAKAAAYN